MRQVVNSRLRFASVEEPFRAYEPWPTADGELEVVDIGPCVAHLPKAEPRQSLEDGLVVFMSEAYRSLAPGGLLTVKAPAASDPHAVADPLAQRYFNNGTWLHFAVPPDMENPAPGVHDFGFRFRLLNLAKEGEGLVVTMEKPE